MRVSLLMFLAACASSEPLYVADETRVTNPRYADRTQYPRGAPAGYVENCPEQTDTVTVTSETEADSETDLESETDSETDTEAPSDPCPQPATTDRESLLALAASRPDDPRGGPRVLATFSGRASYYADSLAGRPTASGEPYDPTLLTAASRTLAFDTVVRVIRIDNGQSVIVRINDRGPFGNRQRVLDLSRAAAERIDMVRAGVVRIRAEVIAR
jgi:rare lipoprotein A